MRDWSGQRVFAEAKAVGGLLIASSSILEIDMELSSETKSETEGGVEDEI